MMQYWIASD